MYKNFYKIYDILTTLFDYLDYAHPCIKKLFTLGNNSVKYDKYSGKTTIVFGDDIYLITDISLLHYISYDYYVANYDNIFDDSLDSIILSYLYVVFHLKIWLQTLIVLLALEVTLVIKQMIQILSFLKNIFYLFIVNYVS